MVPTRLVAALAAGLLTASVLSATAASAEEHETRGPSLPESASQTARDRAEAALARAQALFEERSPDAARRRLAPGGRDATMVLNQLLRVRDDLSPADRKRADALLARPTDGDADPEGDGYTIHEAPPYCGDTVCIHYVTWTADAPPLADDNGNDVPDSVEQALTTAEQVNDSYVAAGYRRPDSDGTLGGESDKVDVYLADIGDQRLYGYCTTDEPYHGDDGPWNYWAYCVIDDDFSARQFGTRNTPLETQQVTLAHEYFHAVQYAYDAFEDTWIMESTATWAEDELFDRVNDNRQYLRDGQLKIPGIPLDSGNGFEVYGNWIFIRYLTERWSGSQAGLPTIVRQMWRKLSGRAGARDLYSTQALQSVLAARRTSFTTVYGQFAAANRTPGRSYSEGRSYPKAAPNRTFTLRRGHRRSGGQATRLRHLTSKTMRFRTGRGLRRRDWAIRLKVDMPHRRTAPVARLVVTRSDGGVHTRAIRLNRRGAGHVVAPFSSRIRHVELVLGNASRRTTCPPKGFTFGPPDFACYGDPKDDGVRTEFHASIFRR